MKYLLLLLLLIPTAAIAQNAKIDSLKRVIETTKVDTVKGRTLCRLCNELRNVGKYEEGLAAGEKCLGIARQSRDRKGEGDCLGSIGSIHKAQGNYSRALDYFQRSLKIMMEIGDRKGEAISLGNIGSIYQNQGNYATAKAYILHTLKIMEEIGNRAGVARCLGNVGIIYSDQGDYARAIEYYQRSFQIIEEIGDRAGMAAILNNIGIIYESQGDYGSALEYDHRSLSIQQEIGDQAGVATSLNNIGSIYSNQGDHARALDYFQRSLKIDQGIGNRKGVASSLCNIGEQLLRLKQRDAARTYAQQGLKLAQEVGHLEHKKWGANVLYSVDSALGNWKSAFEAARLYHVYSDSMKNDEQSKELGRLESKAEYDKQTEIDRIKNEEEKGRERERFTWMLGSAGGGLLLMLVIAFTLFRGRQKEKKANAALRTLNEEIQQQKGEIEAINAELQTTLQEVSIQKQEIEEQHAKIEDSIRYASRIQHAILPSEAQLQEQLPPHFIHYQPRDIVSGDFYWMTQRQGKTFFAAVDCTGHGVPGAFMSVLGSNLLHQIVDENHITEPDVILAELDRRIAATLRQQFGGDSKDGMDLALVVLHEPDAAGKRTVEYTGAGRPLWVWSNGEITEYKSAKYSCGGSQHEDKQYPAHRMEASAGDRLYIFSDGPVDQFGGPKGRKLGSTQLQAFLSETANLPIDEQGKRFGAFFNDWMKSRKQLDDVLLAGVAV